ncbi:CGH_1_HP_G0103050.mRNA.1.CDS.1 [Saccharomyces cerevisiae]|nr:CGH_1_HP_G0103050.mRNA.1.CDS.1 [Saccharomyces cerevisiae]CAI6950185.1 CGH_1_HP_G0103050.mRNA.1.CDS.1 [Saccharomyces cerevisiae]
MKFYNSGVGPTDNSRISLSRTSSSMSVGNNKKHFQNQVDFVCVSGSTSPIIEPLFKLVKQEVEKNNLNLVTPFFTVAQDPLMPRNISMVSMNFYHPS